MIYDKDDEKHKIGFGHLIIHPATDGWAQTHDEMIESLNVQAERTEEGMKMSVKINGETFIATLEDNPTVSELTELLNAGPLTLEMRDYAGFEKVGPLGKTLTHDDQQMTTQSGDIVLYAGDQIVIFYGSNSWAYTKIGHIADLNNRKHIPGDGDVSVTLEIMKEEE